MVTLLLENGHYTVSGLSLKVESKGDPPQKLRQSYEGSASFYTVIL